MIKTTNILKILIPIKYRKKIRNILSQYFSKKILKNNIEKEILLNWQKNNNKKIDIINFSVISWNYRFQRPQQLSTEFSKNGHRVFYIDNEFLISKSKEYPISANKIQENIFNIKLSSTKNYFLYSDTIKTKDQLYVLNSVKNLIQTANIKKAIIKIDHPFWYQICKNLDLPIIYDCMDDHKSFKETPKNVVNIENQLINKANLIVATSKYIKNNIKKINNKKKVIIIGNGVDFKYFNQKPNNIYPKDIGSISKPIIGYYGAINSWIDSDVVKDILNNRPNYNLVMIGRVENNEILKLQKYKNLYLLGEKKYSEIKSYLDYFDVCLIPFVLNSLIKATDPVKVYEFLAAEKKIISSKIPTILKYKKEICFYNKENILNKLDFIIKEKNNNPNKAKIAYNHSWEKITNKYEASINNLLYS